jgi:vitamin B12/bleomycin/antimicrobial peptide transport system ATP-binding/permease protein
MTDRNSETSTAASEVEEAASAGLVPQVFMMVRTLFASQVFYKLLLLGAGIFAVIAATAYEQILLNQWNQPFYNALSNRDFDKFLSELVVFVRIALILLVLNVVQRWLTEMTRLKLREGLVQDLVHQWLQPRRAFKLANAGPIGVNPDQRMHEDARHLTELSTDLGIGLLQATVLLACFVNVLWSLSSGFAFHLQGRSFVVPGYMVWAAVVYAGSASILSYLSGRSLISQNASRYAREAELRFSLMRVNENIDAIVLAGGEADEERRIGVDIRAVLAAMRRLVTSLTRLTWVTAGYGWFTIVAPILVAAPVYFAGNLSFGGLMMAVGAFNQVQSSLRWFVDNFSSIADWRATLLRVASFRSAVLATDLLHRAESRLQTDEKGPAGKLTIENLEIASYSGCNKLREKRIEVRAGERVAIVGETGANEELLFRALAGLWPWGAGRIVWPEGETVSFVPHTPYLPHGPLRELIAYPQKATNFDNESYSVALSRLGLERFIPMLDSDRRWDHELNDDERRAISFARALLHKTDWLLIDETLDSASEATLQRVLDILSKEFAHAGVVYVGREEVAHSLDARIFHLVKDTAARTLRRGKKPAQETGAPPRVPEKAS